MTRHPSVGDEVVTPDFGSGKVVGASATRTLVALHDLGGRVVSYQPGELSRLGGDEDVAGPEEQEAPHYGDGGKGSNGELGGPELCALEAMRFGLVPEEFLDTATLGFDELSQWVERYLPHRRERTTVCEVSGPFGTGKSHTMAVVRRIAARNGYAVARVEVDGSRISLSDPASLLYALWSSLQVEGRRSSTPLTDLYVKAIERHGGYPPGLGSFPSIRNVYDLVRYLLSSGMLEEHRTDIDAFVSSSKTVSATSLKSRLKWPLKALISYSPVSQRPYDFVKSLTGHALLARLAGCRGLVVTVDEFEVEHLGQWGRTGHLVKTLEKYLQGTLAPPEDPLSIFVATVGQEGEETDPAVDRLVRASAGSVWRLRRFGVEEQLGHAMDLFELYAAAYGIDERPSWEVEQTLRQCVMDLAATDESGGPRSFIKSAIGLYDHTYGPPDHGE